MVKKNPIYISVDVETSGPSPGTYSLLSIGACDVYNPQNTFYIEMKPINKNKIIEALKISGLDWDYLQNEGLSPTEAMSRFTEWLSETCQGNQSPIFVAFNAPFDWMFIQYYFQRFLGYNPFGYSALDIKAYYMGLHGVPWTETSMKHVSKRYLDNRKLEHHALRDALDQAEIFRLMLAESGK